MLVGDPGDSGGTFDLSIPGLTGGTATIGQSDGIPHWTPSASCPSAAYTATATYTYDGGHQTSVFTINADHVDMPPAFPL